MRHWEAAGFFRARKRQDPLPIAEKTLLGSEQVHVGAAGREQREEALGVLAAVSEDLNSSSDRSGVEMYRRELFWGQDP